MDYKSIDHKNHRTQLRQRRRKSWLRFIPGVGRLRSLRPGTDAQMGILIDTFAAFATIDDALHRQEAYLILDLLRSAFPEVDHGWLSRRLQKSVNFPVSLQKLALQAKRNLTDTEKMALGLQLFTLISAAGRSNESRSTFEVFMRRMGRPEYGSAILGEMFGDTDARDLPFERLRFGGENPDVVLPDAAQEFEFRVYRCEDLVLVRNMCDEPLWIRGSSLKKDQFLRLLTLQTLMIPDWTLSYEDLVFFLNVKRTENAPTIYINLVDSGITVERTRTRASELSIRFGLNVDIKVLKHTELKTNHHDHLERNSIVSVSHHDRLFEPAGFSLSMHTIRDRATQSGRRFKLASDKQEYRVSNDASSLESGDLLLGPRLAPPTLLYIKYDSNSRFGSLFIKESQNTIYVDDVAVRHNAILRDGSLIRLSAKQAVRCRFSEGFLDEERTQIETLSVEGLVQDFKKNVRALDNVQFQVKRGEMLCIMGPSGSGKSTLLSILSGQKKPTRGKILLNGHQLYQYRDQLVPFIANMPQEDALNSQLTVRENLRHAITIRRPGLSPAEHERRVDTMLAALNLQRIAKRKVGNQGDKTISGGERSRLNLGLDLGSPAELFLFDEPTSGLSSKDSEHVCETLRALAKEKIVIASLHRPNAKVLQQFDRVLLLDNGGKVAFFGSPVDMGSYFADACVELEIAHPSLNSNSPQGADFVFDVLETPILAHGNIDNSGVRRFPSSYWQERFDSVKLLESLGTIHDAQTLTNSAELMSLPSRPRATRKFHSILVIFMTHFWRSFVSKVRNKGSFYSTCLEAPILACLISIALRSSPSGSYQYATALHIPAFLFLSITVAMFLGLTNSATEVLRDRPLLRRERNCQTSALSYMVAKFIALALLSAVQCGIYLLIANYFLEIHGMWLYHWIWMTLTAWTGTSLALVISVWVTTERAALTAVPLLLVPQMLFAGALIQYKEMNHSMFPNVLITRERGGIPVPAYIMPLRYAYEGTVLAQATRNPFEVERIRIQRRIDSLRSKPLLTKAENLQFEALKEGLRSLLAAGASSPKEALKKLSVIRNYAMAADIGALSRIELWPESIMNMSSTRSASEFFVNERIDLMVREAETFRNDYRTPAVKNVYLALKKRLPFTNTPNPETTVSAAYELPGELETQKYCGGILVSTILVCLGIASMTLAYQNRKTD